MNTSYLLSQNQEHQADLNLKTTLGYVLPSLSLSANYGLSQINPEVDLGLDNPDVALSGGLSLSWNLFDGRKTKSLQSARILKKNAELSTLDARRSLQKSIESAHGAYLKSLQILDLKQTTLRSAELNFEQTQEFYRLGQVGSTQFRESQVNLSRVKSSLSQARYSAYLNEMQLWQLTGDIQSKL
jgi:outer membrane protein